ncbi:F-box protein CPR1-like [Rhododendron vialii]|uniref:F-box protein CPR1-like n=1 Tax=Rhododendron vialii TaxID=182163 RepID=UPI00265F8632|nr:F-box protein CPR1-like [Rhododendron vialii]
MSDYISTEILAEILVRLPVESLIRFTSVCKTWHSFITSPSFIAKHLDHTKTNTENLLLTTYTFIDNRERYLLCRGDEFAELVSPLSTSLGHRRVVGKCNGLLCMVDTTSPPCIILWNPLIRKSLILPMPSLPETSPPPFVLGFGAHPTTHEYMLVFIVYEKADDLGKFPSKVELYTQGTGSWRSISIVDHPHQVVRFSCLHAFVNGAIHWIAIDTRVMNGLSSLIMLFNMGSQAFSVMMMPATLVSQSPLCLAIMAYKESLAVLCHGQLEEGSCCIWVMKEYGVAESWAKLYNITLPGVLYQTVGLRKNGKVLLSMSENHKRLLWYDCETKTLTNAGYTGSADAFTADTFMESLVLVKP